MDMNLFAPPIADQAPPMERTRSSLQSAKYQQATGTKKNFSVVLRTVRQEGSESPQKPETISSRNEQNCDGPSVPVNRADCDPSQTEDQSSESERDTVHDDMNGSTDGLGSGREPQQPTLGVQVDSQGMLLALAQTATTDPAVAQPEEQQSPQPEQDVLPTDPPKGAPLNMTLRLTSAGTTARPENDHPINQISQPAEIETSTRGVLAQPLETRTSSETDFRTDQQTFQGEKQPIASSLNKPIADQPANAAPSSQSKGHEQSLPQPVLPEPDVLPIPRELMPQQEMAERVPVDSERSVQRVLLARSISAHAEQDAQPRTGADTADVPASVSSHDRPFPHASQDSGLNWSDGHAHQQEQNGSVPFPQAQPTIQSERGSDPMPERFMTSPVSHPLPRPVAADAPQAAPQAQPVPLPHPVSESSIPAMNRSVAFEVIQPDLGRVNVRVAMTNDMVHTHLSSDRPEIGQFLLNGQDRLQAAFQASGLDMGQFRVDIDRQSSGRWFQHSQSQEQGRPWPEGSGHSQQDHRSPEPDGRRMRAAGILNLVA